MARVSFDRSFVFQLPSLAFILYVPRETVLILSVAELPIIFHVCISFREYRFIFFPALSFAC